jgi:hypothetical protein
MVINLVNSIWLNEKECNQLEWWTFVLHCRILGKHHTPKMGGVTFHYIGRIRLEVSNTIQDHIQLYISNTRPQSQVD